MPLAEKTDYLGTYAEPTYLFDEEIHARGFRASPQ